MGIVYEAEQDRPHRRVALKIVRPGLVPADVLRRFELEYEFLGRLHHPGIAQIFQAGIEETVHGPQPYFAMELVRGTRLDDYIRLRKPTLRERLVLVAAIGDAVQHAHHRGIIHRDLKPANILVTETGEPKVLDFGIARAAHDNLLTTMHTAVGEVLGTLSYMSPEQVAGDVAALDTRSDVYALGVILYEVLAERPPYQLDRKSFAEAARIIHDHEPTRLGTTTTGAVPADVETIVAKALEKEKERRYSSAAELAEDIRRFLRDEPITARPASAAYQVRKFARRHKALVAGVMASVVVLVIGVAATAWQAIRASRAERVAEARAHDAEMESAKADAVTTFLTDMLASVDPSQARGREVTVREALDAAAGKIDGGAMTKQPAVEIAVRNAIGSTYAGLGLFDEAERQLRTALDLESRTTASPLVRADTDSRLVNVLYQSGKYAAAEPVAREALKLRREALGTSHADVATALDDLGAILMAAGNSAAAEPLMREALTIRRKLLAPDDPDLAVGLNNLAYVIWKKGDFQQAESMYREALSIDRRRLGNDHPEIPSRLINLVVLLSEDSRPQAAEPLAREAVATRRKILGDQHPAMANTLDALAGVLEDQGKDSEAERLLRDALAIAVRSFGEVHRETARQQLHLGWLLWKEGAYAEAEPLLRTAAVNIPKIYGPDHRMARGALANLAHDLNSLGDARAAESTARQALALYRKAPTDNLVVIPLVALSHALIAEGRRGEAVPHLREALDLAEGQRLRYAWFKAEIQSTLGSVLAAQGELTEAEPLLLGGYEGLRDTSSSPPPRLRLSVERLIAFYVAHGRPAAAAPWRARLQSLDESRRAARAATARPSE
jgi:tetratricopeptide (TPR) repeat protein